MRDFPQFTAPPLTEADGLREQKLMRALKIIQVLINDTVASLDDAFWPYELSATWLPSVTDGAGNSGPWVSIHWEGGFFKGEPAKLLHLNRVRIREILLDLIGLPKSAYGHDAPDAPEAIRIYLNSGFLEDISAHDLVAARRATSRISRKDLFLALGDLPSVIMRKSDRPFLLNGVIYPESARRPHGGDDAFAGNQECLPGAG